MKVLLLSKFERLGASSRMRSLQYLPLLEDLDLDVISLPLISDEMLQARYDRGRYAFGDLLKAYAKRIWALSGRKKFDVVWIEKEALPWLPLWLEEKLLRGVPYVLDYDDATFHSYDLHRRAMVRILFGSRLDRLMSAASLVIGGNNYLAQRARNAGAHQVEVLPTAIDLDRYKLSKIIDADKGKILTIVWIGSPSTVRYLSVLASPLKELAKNFEFKLRVIGGVVEMPGVFVECLEWTEQAEVDLISSCDAGIMPLDDSLWERGKCGYKLIQYMACQLPVVASGVGVNSEMVVDWENGFIANSAAEWIDRLGLLLGDAALRRNMGFAGRRLVEEKYCIQKVGPLLANLLKVAGSK